MEIGSVSSPISKDVISCRKPCPKFLRHNFLYSFIMYAPFPSHSWSSKKILRFHRPIHSTLKAPNAAPRFPLICRDDWRRSFSSSKSKLTAIPQSKAIHPEGKDSGIHFSLPGRVVKKEKKYYVVTLNIIIAKPLKFNSKLDKKKVLTIDVLELRVIVTSKKQPSPPSTILINWGVLIEISILLVGDRW